jgi:hypothetical protein
VKTLKTLKTREDVFTAKTNYHRPVTDMRISLYYAFSDDALRKRVFTPMGNHIQECLSFYHDTQLDVTVMPAPAIATVLGELPLLLQNAASAHTGHFVPFVYVEEGTQ